MIRDVDQTYSASNPHVTFESLSMIAASCNLPDLQQVSATGMILHMGRCLIVPVARAGGLVQPDDKDSSQQCCLVRSAEAMRRELEHAFEAEFRGFTALVVSLLSTKDACSSPSYCPSFSASVPPERPSP